ncbi:hypothetical protein FA15DRAFT_673023 [Coprinopsis marcescibilis]|uniref:Arrestin-like N-terminal domain-containing protein n=1 Tax=Coprinopsis marcescibilis TaxID=230819 RepID=A0A5C3KKV0_COPMA|nr:hypothetical protein FA15DRAFT_673023 [Coprinopsis marcescibilis]
MSPAILPAYHSPTESPPSYTDSPQEDETTVAHSPRTGSRSHQGTCVKCWKEVTIILKDQDESSPLPVFSRGGIINGEVGVSNPECVVEITAKLSGQMSLMITDCGSTGAVLVSEKKVIWSQDSEGNLKGQCPSILPFLLRFPQTFQDHDARDFKLPPSFEATFLGVPALFAKCVYTLTITISTTKRYGLASWNRSRMFSMVLDYRPRTRPNRPIVMVDTIFASIKPVPEEWKQLILTMGTRSGSKCRPVECHLLLPSIQTFAISDTVPFHLQLRGSLECLREILPPSSCLLDPNHEKIRERTLDLTPTGPHSIRVYLARQVHLEVNGRKRFRTCTVGTSQMWPVPPVIPREGETSSVTNDLDDICLDWQGELKCREDVSVASFHAGSLAVKDFLVVGLAPSDISSSFLRAVQLVQPIRLVTDSWVEIEQVHPRDV